MKFRVARKFCKFRPYIKNKYMGLIHLCTLCTLWYIFVLNLNWSLGGLYLWTEFKQINFLDPYSNVKMAERFYVVKFSNDTYILFFVSLTFLIQEYPNNWMSGYCSIKKHDTPIRMLQYPDASISGHFYIQISNRAYTIL